MQERYKFYKYTHIGYKNQKKYEVSNYGNVKINGQIIKPTVKVGKYLNICNNYLHRIVAELFIPNPDNKPEIDHIDGNPENNRIDNLRWCTHKENLNNPISKKRNSDTKKKAYTDINYYNNFCKANKQRDFHKMRISQMATRRGNGILIFN